MSNNSLEDKKEEATNARTMSMAVVRETDIIERERERNLTGNSAFSYYNR